MATSRDEAAALNNAEWCAAVWRSHGLPVEEALGLWFCTQPVPRTYPNIVTVNLTAEPVQQAKFIAGLMRAFPSLNATVKDSFANLDLRPARFEPQFDAYWMLRSAQATLVSPADAALRWRKISSDKDLTAWEDAQRGKFRSGKRIFVPQLLQDAKVIVLGGFDERGAIRAGGIAYDSAGVLGITNVFGADGAFVRALVARHPESAIVRYESGDDVRTAEQSGFRPLGPLRIWSRIGWT